MQAMAILDSSGRAVACGARLRVLLALEGDGCAGLEVLLRGSPLLECLHDRAAARDEVELGDGRAVTLEAEAVGSWVLLTAEPKGAQEGDETAALPQAARVDEPRLRLLARLADGVAHDLRNPLNALLLRLELLEGAVGGEPRGDFLGNRSGAENDGAPLRPKHAPGRGLRKRTSDLNRAQLVR
jgi:signal transduction histidine kinase